MLPCDFGRRQGDTLPTCMSRISYFNITYRCNSNCLFCAADNGNASNHLELPVEAFAQLLKEQRIGSKDRVVVNGGEPTMHRDFFEILAAIRKAGAYIDLFTNGVQLHDLGSMPYRNSGIDLAN